MRSECDSRFRINTGHSLLNSASFLKNLHFSRVHVLKLQLDYRSLSIHSSKTVGKKFVVQSRWDEMISNDDWTSPRKNLVGDSL